VIAANCFLFVEDYEKFAAGACTILLALLLHEISFRDLINVLPPILIVAFSANLFYTLGWNQLLAR